MGRPLKIKSVEEMQQKIDAYFDSCWEINDDGKREQTRPYTVTGLANALDISRQTLLEYEGEVEGREKKDPGYADTIKKAKQRVQQWVEEQLYRKTQVTGAIFNLKNNFNWVDRQDFTTKGDKLEGVTFLPVRDQD